jgi:exonuclease SbcD
MRILHTSDWHLGHSFHDRTRSEEQAFFLDWMARAVAEHQVDALVVAGDVFDTQNPPGEAQQQYYRFLAKLATSGAPTRSGGPRTVVIVGGNHDSPTRLDAPREVLQALNVRVVGGYDPSREASGGDAAGALIPLAGAGGQVGLVVAAVPFLSDWRIGVRGMDSSPEDQLQSMHDSFRAVYSRMADRAEAGWSGVPVIATGHLTCLSQRGSKVSAEDAAPMEINRVGTLGSLDPGVFDERFAYVALGHLHRGFPVDSFDQTKARVWYSGTPVQVSTTEKAEDRQALLVDVEGGRASITPLLIPAKRRLLALQGTLEQVRAELAGLALPGGELPPYVTVDVTLEQADAAVHARILEAAQKNRACGPLVVQVRAEVTRRGEAPRVTDLLPRGRDLLPEEAFRFAWKAKHGAESEPSEAVLVRFRHLVEQHASGGEQP